MAYQAGQQFGHYRLLRFLGRGGFAEVYLGEHIYLYTQAALKILHLSLAEEYRQQFLTEARTIAHLDHPHIVQVHDYGIQGDTPFLVMRYAPHGSIRTVHPPGTRLPLDTIVLYVNQIASALQHAHDYKLIHRDVKPENILLGHQNHLLLSDFGLATVARSSQQNPADIAGTVTYMAPEQFQGTPCPASDQYALGIVVYEWLTGAPPFTGSRLEVAVQHMMASPFSLREKVPDLVPEIEQVLLVALSKKPQERFPSITAFAAALEHAIHPQEAFALKSKGPSPFTSLKPQPLVMRSQQHQLVGREQEMRLLHEALLETEQYRYTTSLSSAPTAHYSWQTSSRCPCLMLLGDAGMGKTRLAEEASRAAQQRGWTVVWSRGYKQERIIPYRLWTDVVRTMFEQQLSNNLEQQPLPSHYRPLTVLMPELLNHFKEQGTSLPFLPGQEPLRLWEALLVAITSVSERTPVLIVLDDLQWADESSYSFLSYLCRHILERPVLLVGTCRETELSPMHSLRTLFLQLEREELAMSLSLSALADTQIATLIGHLPASSIAAIQRQAAGNPLFAEELARQFEQQKRDKERQSSPKKQNTSVPAIVAALFNQRLSSLSPACQQFLRSAAVLGRSFSLTIICNLFTKAQTILGEKQWFPAIEEALQAGILLEQEQGTDITYHFWHPLFMQYLYETLSVAKRTQLHHSIATLLQHLYVQREDEGAATIVHHLLRGHGDGHQIAHYAELAGHHAYALTAYPEAERYYLLAINHLQSRHREGNITSIKENLHLASLQELLGECLRIQGKLAGACNRYEQALEIYRQQSDVFLPLDKSLQPQLQALLQGKIGQTWFDRGNTAQALQYYKQAEQLLETTGIASGAVWAYLCLQHGYAHWRQGQYVKAYHVAYQALTSVEDEPLLQNFRLESFSSGTLLKEVIKGKPINLARTHQLLGLIANGAGQCSNALNHFDIALRLYEQYNSQREIAIVCCNIGDIQIRTAEYSLAQTFLHRSLDTATRIGDIPSMSVTHGNLGLLAARYGFLADAEIEIKRAITLIEHTNSPVYTSIFHAYLATFLYEQGKQREAIISLYHSLSIARVLKITPHTGAALVTLGKMRLLQAYFIDHNNIQRWLFDEKSLQRFRRAKKTLEHALATQDIEIETRIEGLTALAQVSFFLGEHEQAYQQTISVQNEARQFELAWLTPWIQRLLGNILEAQCHYEQAHEHFERSLETAEKYHMHLEAARTMLDYGKALLLDGSFQEAKYQQGLRYLHEARQRFIKCNAMLDLQSVEQFLASREELRTHEVLT